MATIKTSIGISVLEAARNRIRYTFDNFEKVYISFSAGKDSSVMFHLVMEEAIKRNKRVGVLLIDLEAQYSLTIKHAKDMFVLYKDYIDVHWVCLPIKLRNSVSNYEPVWCAWDPDRKQDWVRELPKFDGVISDTKFFDFFEPWMEFEEFIELFAIWYSNGESTAAFIGIRSDESLNRYRTIAVFDKNMHYGKRWTTQVVDGVYNVYPIYDWHVTDIWKFHSHYPDKPHNEIYDRMHLAGVSLSQMRLCQPYGDDQKRGLWLYHLLEPQTWGKVVARVNGVNGGALYIEETGNITGYNKITLPDGHTWKSFCNLLLNTMPEVTRNHYIPKFNSWIKGWHDRGYTNGIPDFAPPELEKKMWVPSWRRVCKVLLRNDWWCKGLGLTQPKSEAYGKYLKIRNDRKSTMKSNATLEASHD
jgi:predicted phosphoadenosine phosphosulfate sulfurtransferase